MRGQYEQLKERLPDAPILIGMVGVLDAVGGYLERDGFNLLNQGARIPFPAMGNHLRFNQLARKALENLTVSRI